MSRYFPILDELFSSDSVVFFLLGLAIAAILCWKLKSRKARLRGMLVALVLYALCEVLANVVNSYMAALLLLFVGTQALGAMCAFLLGAVFGKR